ncbi:MAG: energy-coupling factor transporter transmembrane component T [Collinsella sp.]|nr:energy-coupling factor transporter transmembrane component T [Collinsella sp.]
MADLIEERGDSAFERWLRGLNPGTKLAFVLLTGFACMVSPGSILGAVLIILLFAIAAAARSLGPFARLMFGFGIPITVMLLFIQGLYSPANETIIFDFGFAKMGLEGVLSACKTVTTLLVFLGGFTHMNRTTKPSELVAALTERGLPPKAGYLVLASLNVVPQMKRRMSTIQEAQIARGLDIEGGALSRVRAMVPLLGPVVMSSLTDAEERSMTLETHGFHLNDVRHTTYVEVKHSSGDTPVVAFASVLFLLATAARIASVVGVLGL